MRGFLGSDWYRAPKSSEMWISEVTVCGILSLFGCTSWPLEKKNSAGTSFWLRKIVAFPPFWRVHGIQVQGAVEVPTWDVFSFVFKTRRWANPTGAAETNCHDQLLWLVLPTFHVISGKGTPCWPWSWKVAQITAKATISMSFQLFTLLKALAVSS